MSADKEQAEIDLENALGAIRGGAAALVAIGDHAGMVDREAIAHLAHGLQDSYRTAQDAFCRLFDLDGARNEGGAQEEGAA